MKGAGLLALGLSMVAFSGAIGGNAAISQLPTVNDAAVLGEMPRALSEFGFFSDMREQSGSQDVTSYRLNTPLYSDGADKLRFVYTPAGESFTADGDGLLQFPVGSALIKTFAFGEGDERQLIETRVLREGSMVLDPPGLALEIAAFFPSDPSG